MVAHRPVENTLSSVTADGPSLGVSIGVVGKRLLNGAMLGSPTISVWAVGTISVATRGTYACTGGISNQSSIATVDCSSPLFGSSDSVASIASFNGAECFTNNRALPSAAASIGWVSSARDGTSLVTVHRLGGVPPFAAAPP